MMARDAQGGFGAGSGCARNGRHSVPRDQAATARGPEQEQRAARRRGTATGCVKRRMRAGGGMLSSAAVQHCSLVHKLEDKGAEGGVQLAHVLHQLQVGDARHQLRTGKKTRGTHAPQRAAPGRGVRAPRGARPALGGMRQAAADGARACDALACAAPGAALPQRPVRGCLRRCQALAASCCMHPPRCKHLPCHRGGQAPTAPRRRAGCSRAHLQQAGVVAVGQLGGEHHLAAPRGGGLGGDCGSGGQPGGAGW